MVRQLNVCSLARVPHAGLVQGRHHAVVDAIQMTTAHLSKIGMLFRGFYGPTRSFCAKGPQHPLQRLHSSPIPATSGLKGRSFEITGDPSVPDSAPSSFVKMTCSRANFRAVGWKDEVRKA
eukprot:1983577-Pleurochrysis_carterae.AAC.3